MLGVKDPPSLAYIYLKHSWHEREYMLLVVNTSESKALSYKITILKVVFNFVSFE
jgi:hypothetical protein